MAINVQLATDMSLPSDFFKNLEEEEQKKEGRPTLCTPELVNAICELIACTPKGLKTIIKENPWMPAQKTLLRWQNRSEPEYVEFSRLFAIAKQKQIECQLNFNHDISDDIIETLENVHPQKAGAYVQAAKLRIETRQKYAEMLEPTKYKLPPKAEEKKSDDDANLTDAERLEKVKQILNPKKD